MSQAQSTPTPAPETPKADPTAQAALAATAALEPQKVKVKDTKPDSPPKLTLISGLKECTFSSVPKERRMAWQFWLSLLGIVLVFVVAGRTWWEHKQVNDARAAVVAQRAALEAEERKRLLAHYTVEIGLFSMELKGEKPTPTPRGTVNLAQVEIVAECDTDETCEFIHNHPEGARSALTGVLVPMDRHELLTKRGKTRVKNSIVDGLNRWLSHGSVKTIYFSRFVIN